MTILADASVSDDHARLAARRATERARMVSPLGRRRRSRLSGFVGLIALLIATLVASFALGARTMPFGTVIDALFAFDPTITDHLVVHDLRLPRTLAGLLVGIALAVSGVLMQAITRNPLADPGLLGVNSGASLAVVIAIWVFGITAFSGLVWFAFIGAGVVAILVYVLGSLGRGGATPVRLALAGSALNALLLALVSAVLLVNQQTLDTYRFWVVGSLAGADFATLPQLLPFVAVGLALAIAAATSLNAVALGDDAATALGTCLTRTRVLTIIGLTLLCGAAVAAAGPIGFVGLVVPHAARFWCGPDQRWLLAYSSLLGPIVLIASDVIGRIILPPGEVQVGIMTALIGGPLFVAIVRRIRMAPL